MVVSRGHVRLESVKGFLINLKLIVYVPDDVRATFLVTVATSPGPPGPTDIQVLKALGNIFDVLESTVGLRDSLDCVPLVHENRDVVLIPEVDNELVEVVDVPLLVEIDILVSVAIWAALRNPSLVEIAAFVVSWIFRDSVIEHILIRIEVVEGVDDIRHTC